MQNFNKVHSMYFIGDDKIRAVEDGVRYLVYQVAWKRNSTRNRLKLSVSCKFENGSTKPCSAIFVERSG